MKTSVLRWGIFALIACCSVPPVFAQGVMLRCVGAVNESVGGVAAAMPIDASGALYWNPASISAFKQNEIQIGVELIQPHSRATAEIPGTPFVDSRKSETGITPVPSMAFVWKRCPKSPLTFGLGVAGVGGASALYAHTASSPLGTALDPALGTGAGATIANSILGKSSNVIVMQITPTVSMQITDKLSVGAAPVIDLASLTINPMSLGGIVDDSLVSYGTRYAWGGGFQIGTYYDFKNHFKAGFMFKSPIWAENIYFSGVTQTGPHARSFDLNLPLTLAGGLSFDGFRNTIIGFDVRYLDYAHTAGFKKGLNPLTGVVEGLDWDSVFSIGVGAEHRFTNKLKGRIGYSWNENPIPSRSTVLNVSAPLLSQHLLTFGFGYEIQRNLEFSLTYAHAFRANVSGMYPDPRLPLLISNEASADTVSAGISKKW
ncbi:MAG: outer membrane protein transport protein [Planctomycetaceae bacterium]|nr:outer membrane protein transport protein [Planctomycetaceae bacterium]